MQLIAHKLDSLISIPFVRISPNLIYIPPGYGSPFLAGPYEGGAYVKVDHVIVLHTQSLK